MPTIKLAVTPGEPAGIGPDLIIQLAQQQWDVQLTVFADANMLQQRAALLGLPLTLHPYTAQAEQIQNPGCLYCVHIPLGKPVVAGQLNQANSHYVLETLTQAGARTLSGEFSAIVTGPVHKGIINQAGVPFSGHTEFFAEQSNTPKVVMMLATEGLRVVLATTHIPLMDVAKSITQAGLSEVIRIVNNELKHKFAISQPHIFVCGLNPHAGEDGHIGKEELTIINPALDMLRAESVDHGTALDFAGTGNAETGSFAFAIQSAISLVNNYE